MHRAASEALFEEQTKHLSGALLEERNWRVMERAFPVLDVLFQRDGRHPIRVRMECNDWNEHPPSITLHNEKGDLLTQLPSGPSSVFNSSPHPITNKSFICMSGSREYHTHSSHISDSWSNYKAISGFDIGGILGQVWSFWMKSTP